MTYEEMIDLIERYEFGLGTTRCTDGRADAISVVLLALIKKFQETEDLKSRLIKLSHSNWANELNTVSGNNPSGETI